MVGINDMQPLKDGADTLDPLSDKWREAYGQRVERLLAPFRQAHIPVPWVGLPPMRDERFNAQVVKLNEIYREHAEKAGAQIHRHLGRVRRPERPVRRLRARRRRAERQAAPAADGIHFTKAGSRKLAQFLEAEIRQAFDKVKPQDDIANLPPDIEQAADDINAQIRREMGAPRPRRRRAGRLSRRSRWPGRSCR